MAKTVDGFGRAVGLTLALRCWQVLRAPGTVMLVVAFLNQVEQGVYYTILSIAGLTVLFELGFGQVLTQMTARISGQEGPRAAPRLGALLHVASRFYGWSAIAFFATSSAWGAWLLNSTGSTGWHFALIATTSITACCIWTNGHLAFLEGVGQAASVSAWRLAGTIAGGVTSWALMPAFGLHAVAAINGGLLLSGLLCIARHTRLLKSFAERQDGSVSFHKEVWPTQWRIGLSWISGYFIFQIGAPLTILVCGAIDAGRLGLTWSAVSAIPLIALSQVSPRFPQFSELIAKGLNAEAIHLHRASSRRAVGLAILVGGGLMLTLAALQYISPATGARFLDQWTTLTLVVASIIYVPVSSMAVLLRARGGEPFLHISILQAAGHVILGTLGTYLWGPFGLALSYLIVTAGIGLPLGLRLYMAELTRQNNNTTGAVQPAPR